MYSIRLVSTLSKDEAIALVSALRGIRLPVYVTISEAKEGQFFTVHAGCFTSAEAARAGLASAPILTQRAGGAAAAALPPDAVPWSPQGKLFGAQLMALQNLDTAFDIIRGIARIGLGPVLRCTTLQNGQFGVLILCSLTPNRGEAAENVQSLAKRSQWKPILAEFP